MDIEHTESADSGSFIVTKDNKTVAEMTYSFKKPDTLVIQHTEVDASLRGENIGIQLINKAVSFAREKKFKIKPVCSFVRSEFKKNPEEYNDVI